MKTLIVIFALVVYVTCEDSCRVTTESTEQCTGSCGCKGGTSVCICPEGTTLVDGVCGSANPCDGHSCPLDHQSCVVNGEGEPTCECEAPYGINYDTNKCEDCSDPAVACGMHSSCYIENYTLTCGCDDGYIDNGSGECIKAPEPPAPEDCKDKRDECPNWAEIGECRANPEYLLKECPESCGQCSGIEVAGCLDTLGDLNTFPAENPNCSTFVAAGKCHTHDTQTEYDAWHRCPHACDICQAKLPKGCYDRGAYCVAYKAGGSSCANDKYMIDKCEKLCGACT